MNVLVEKHLLLYRATVAPLVLVLVLVVSVVVDATPVTYYANIGDSAQLQCGGGGLVCYSTYADKNVPFGMVSLTPSYKYQIQGGYVTVMNVQATDAGFYTCAGRCDQVTYDQLAYYLQPTMSGVPIDTSQNWIAIPPNAFDDNLNRNRYYVVVSNESSNLYGQGTGLSVGEIVGLVIGVALAVLLTLIVIIVLCILNRKRKRRNQDKSVDYSTIERDYGSSAGNTLTSQHQGEITTRSMTGPGLYRPNINEYNSGSTRSATATGGGDLPNIDIGAYADKKTASNRSQNRVQFPDTVARTQQLPPIDPRPRYVASNENIHLQQIVQETRLIPNMLEDEFERQHPYQYNQNVSSDEPETEGPDGGVTVVSARTPVRALDQQLKQQQQQQQQPPTGPPAPPKAYVNQSQPPPPKQYPGLSLSHRIETTSTPLSVPISSSSLRNGGSPAGAQLQPAQSTPLRHAGSINKDGATDV